ncbi:DUF1149 family protein [Tetragenococcus solitarius]|uniref:DUF1149 family protein n=1 Tax=Tetragenococcus solitarius TaxID=71453 RepID=A0ABN3YEA0_9ENTE|nr:DUF1149 family protein [Tetragenococcus solitarius]
MQIKRQQPLVEAYHFDQRKKEEKELKTRINIGLAPLKAPNEDYPKENSIIGTRLRFEIVFNQFIIRGAMGQINHIVNQDIQSQEDLTKEEIDELMEPLFDILQRLTYEVTEIITDKPGINLDFERQE